MQRRRKLRNERWDADSQIGPTHVVMVRLTPDLLEYIQDKAASQERSLAYIMRKMIERDRAANMASAQTVADQSTTAQTADAA